MEERKINPESIRRKLNRYVMKIEGLIYGGYIISYDDPCSQFKVMLTKEGKVHDYSYNIKHAFTKEEKTELKLRYIDVGNKLMGKILDVD